MQNCRAWSLLLTKMSGFLSLTLITWSMGVPEGAMLAKIFGRPGPLFAEGDQAENSHVC